VAAVLLDQEVGRIRIGVLIGAEFRLGIGTCGRGADVRKILRPTLVADDVDVKAADGDVTAWKVMNLRFCHALITGDGFLESVAAMAFVEVAGEDGVYSKTGPLPWRMPGDPAFVNAENAGVSLGATGATGATVRGPGLPAAFAHEVIPHVVVGTDLHRARVMDRHGGAGAGGMRRRGRAGEEGKRQCKHGAAGG
jgi:hypothetical protein